MNFLSNLRIGTQLGIGFAIVLLLSILSSSVALVHAREAAAATGAMLEGPLANERIVADWYVPINSAIARTAIIAKSADDTLSKTSGTGWRRRVVLTCTKKGYADWHELRFGHQPHNGPRKNKSPQLMLQAFLLHRKNLRFVALTDLASHSVSVEGRRRDLAV